MHISAVKCIYVYKYVVQRKYHAGNVLGFFLNVFLHNSLLNILYEFDLKFIRINIKKSQYRRTACLAKQYTLTLQFKP